MPGIQCRGRNGWFDLDEISTVTDDRYAIVDLFSRKRGKNPPIIIHGDRTEIERLFRDTADKIKNGGIQGLKMSMGQPKSKIYVCPECEGIFYHSLVSNCTYGYECERCKHIFGMPKKIDWDLDKPPQNLAMEIISKSRYRAEEHLRNHGASYSQAAEAVARVLSAQGQIVTGSPQEVADAIYDSCKEKK